MAREIMRYFSYQHLRDERLQEVSRQFAELAVWIDAQLPDCAESSMALRHLLEAKDAAVRSAL